ncbi:MAG: hypothetical protein KKE17_00525 [Proteobacteria bacterium]|nr:hypothetical protein [Pseudomonadota bacterium]MBU1708466.1 hypothetical protein [Pseudomonadota bacterium]
MGGIVNAYKAFEDIEAGVVFKSSKSADKEGLFSIEMPLGSYYFTTSGKHNGKDYFAFHGNNPFAICDKNVWLALMANPVTSARYSPGETSISGLVTFKGKPLKDAYISIYLPTAKTFKGLGLKTESINQDGSFHIPISAGKYVLVAKKLIGSSGIRPPQRGDLFGYFPANPVEVKEGQIAHIEIPSYPKGDRTAFIDIPEVKTNDFITVEDLSASRGSGIKGKVVDADGKAIHNIYVMAYENTAPVFQMYHLSHGTQYSSRTDKDGNYFIPIDTSGEYFVVARDTLGDGPHRGEVYGLYQDNPMHKVIFNNGDLVEDVDIVAGGTMAREIDRPVNEPVRLVNIAIGSDITIDKNTVWAGNILVNGVVSIKRGVTLEIEPGATVKFERIDRDNNNIGDGEIMVEGRIIARGSSERKITFTSAEKEPKPKDWSYVNIIASGAPNVFEHCVFEYGYSGIQSHYSNATVTDSLFHKNNEGLHFNTVNLVAERNSFIDNGVGIKFSRLEGKVLLRHNLVTNNGIGIQFVHQHINAVDFDNLHKVIEPPVFEENSIYANSKYDFSMGDRQAIDLSMKNNWWGSDSSAVISDHIFDKNDDDELGVVLYDPFLKVPPVVGVR